ncbi:hypothetical protein QUC32_29995 (plasmid) [Novosphingobium resinovorum]|nr:MULTISPECIES: hypothetical protein [Novosphingobium]MBF7015209.1 hypothetical protein [Novosphingobium sp. HR1a]WJM29888.1 hypothetical protein QUC32_29995 [Novosphingobium resinovorum]
MGFAANFTGDVIRTRFQRLYRGLSKCRAFSGSTQVLLDPRLHTAKRIYWTFIRFDRDSGSGFSRGGN